MGGPFCSSGSWVPPLLALGPSAAGLIVPWAPRWPHCAPRPPAVSPQRRPGCTVLGSPGHTLAMWFAVCQSPCPRGCAGVCRAEVWDAREPRSGSPGGEAAGAGRLIRRGTRRVSGGGRASAPLMEGARVLKRGARRRRRAAWATWAPGSCSGGRRRAHRPQEGRGDAAGGSGVTLWGPRGVGITAAQRPPPAPTGGASAQPQAQPHSPAGCTCPCSSP